MPRQVRDASLETRTARSRLKWLTGPLPADRTRTAPRLSEARQRPWDVGWALLPGTGTDSTEYLRTPGNIIVVADDYADADNHGVLSFTQAQDRVDLRPDVVPTKEASSLLSARLSNATQQTSNSVVVI